MLGLKPGEEVPRSVRVLLGGPAEDPRSLPVRADREATLVSVYARLDERPTARAEGGYQRVVFGVDPGHVIGLAVLADGQWLHVAEARSPEEAVARVASWAAALSAHSWTVHVGDGHPTTSRGLVPAFRKALPQARVRFVPEEKTSPFRPVTHSRHTDAAIHIARREPRP